MKRTTGFAIISLFVMLLAVRCSLFNGGVPATAAPTQGNPADQSVLTPTAAPGGGAQTATGLPQATPTPQPGTPTLVAPSPTSTSSPSPTALPTASPTSPPEATATGLPPSPAVTSAPSAPEESGSPAQTGCLDKAAFSDDVTYPDGALVKPGERFTKTWKIHNESTCDWSGYSLIYAGGDAMNAAMSHPIQDVKVGEYFNLSLDLVASTRGGLDTGYWQFKNASGQTFGVGSGAQGLIWVQVTVDYPTPVPTSGAETSGSSPGLPATGACPYTQNDDYVSQILASINAARAQNGLKALKLSDKLSAAALAHSIDMACNDFISHDGSDGSTWYDRVKAQGVANYTSTRENIYVGNPAFGGDAQGAFTWWMNSKIHHDNILYPTVTEVGIAYVYTASSTYGGYYTLDLARP